MNIARVSVVWFAADVVSASNQCGDNEKASINSKMKAELEMKKKFIELYILRKNSFNCLLRAQGRG
jgi:hypothetical protein